MLSIFYFDVFLNVSLIILGVLWLNKEYFDYPYSYIFLRIYDISKVA